MERKENSFCSSPAKQIPFETTFFSHSSANSTTQAPSDSPRRRNAPIDIDTALRLQSQANYVQEPAVRSNSLAAATTTNSTNVQPTRALSSQQQQWPATLIENTKSTCTGEQSNNGQTINRLEFQSNISLNNYYDQHYISCASKFRAAAAASNISVDYIDCLSNEDLIRASNNSLQETTGRTGNIGELSPAANMRCIPSCRKHLSHRFNRNHRIEPGLAVVGEHQQQQQQVETSSDNVDKQPTNSDSNSLITTRSNQTTNPDEDSLLLASVLDHDQQSRPANQSGVLYPIPVSDAKKRTYFIGSVSQDSLLSHDELHRYFPNGRVSIFACTWNQNRKRAPTNLNDLLLPERLVYMPDIYAIGIQEAYSSQQDYLREWEIELQTTLGPNHVLLHSCTLGTLHLALFIRRDLIWFCSTPEESLYNSRSMPTNMIKTKGAISIAFRFFGTSFMFTNCHFPAHENKVKDRVDEYQRIRNSIDLPKNLKQLKPRYLSNDSTARFDCVFFMGDLNFRLEQRTFDETIQILEDVFQSKEPTYEALTQNDELLKVMESQQAFNGFDEGQIKFPPTYKFLAQTNKYDRQAKRVPSYTDRILFRSKRQRHIQCLIYDWLPQLLSSDHKPVFGLFDVLIRPGHEKNMVSSLNAGLFQRAVYVEALKRRAEDSDGLRENGVGGNLICSIS